jgi:hypothetical protein
MAVMLRGSVGLSDNCDCDIEIALISKIEGLERSSAKLATVTNFKRC